MNETIADKRLIAIVCQRPFGGYSGKQFCKLAPWFYKDGELVELADFYNDHEIFWMLTPQTELLAQPGRLLSVVIEESPEFSKEIENNSRFRVVLETASRLMQKEAVEIIEISPSAIDHIENIASSDTRINCPYPPGDIVLIKWKDNIYGLFKTQDIRENHETQGYNFQVRSLSPNPEVLKISLENFEQLAKNYIRQGKFNLSLEDKHRRSSRHSVDITYQLLLPSGLELFLESNIEKVNIEPFDQVFLRLSRDCVSRATRSELRSILDQIKKNERSAKDISELQRQLQKIESLNNRQEKLWIILLKRSSKIKY